MSRREGDDLHPLASISRRFRLKFCCTIFKFFRKSYMIKQHGVPRPATGFFGNKASMYVFQNGGKGLLCVGKQPVSFRIYPSFTMYLLV